jgi:hypothetical protein
MKELKDMTREELLEIIRIKDVMLRELHEELEAYQLLVNELQGNLSGTR